MIAKVFGFDLEIKIEPLVDSVLVVQNHKLFSKLAMELSKTSSDEILFLEEDKIISFKELICIQNIIDFDLNSKTNLDLLFSKVDNDISLQPEIEQDIQNHFSQINKKLVDELNEFNIDTEFIELMDFKKYLKLLKLQLSYDKEDDILNRVINIIEFYSEFTNKTLIFINLLQYLEEDEFKEILKYKKYKNQKTLFIENNLIYNPFKESYIIDDDLYEYLEQNHQNNT
jgi:CRISPR type II-A-associated protein Csn2